MENQNALARAKKLANAKLAFCIHVTIYVVANALLIAINLATSTERLWFVWPLSGWGIGILAHALAIFGLSKGPSVQQWMVDRELRKSAPKKT